MAQEDFFKSLWRILRLVSPAGGGGGGTTTNGSAIRQELVGANLWLYPDAIEKYDPFDFVAWPPEARHELHQAVEGFRTAASAVASGNPATPEQRAAAAEQFARVVAVVQPVIREDWTASVGALFEQVEGWCRTREWATRRFPKEIEEPLLGRYKTAELLVHLSEGRFILNPVTRFVSGTGTGLVDFYAMPALAGRSIVRRAEGWEILPGSPRGRAKPWSEPAFVATIKELARDAA